MSTPSLVVVPPTMNSSLPLYAVEETLAVYVETAELVPPAEEAEFLAEFTALLTQAVEKRDRMGQFMAHLEAQIGLANHEIQRLQERKEVYMRALEKAEEYVGRVIQSLGTDRKGKWKKLEGNTVTFSLKKNPPSVRITDEGKIPAAYQLANATIKMRAEQWTLFLDSLDLELRAQLLDGANVEFTPSKSAIKAALEHNEPVAGAELPPASYRLERK